MFKPHPSQTRMDLVQFSEQSLLFLVFLSILGGLILVFLLWKQHNSTVKTLRTSLCDSPDCVRCQQKNNDDQAVTATLKKRCIQYISQQQSTKNPDDILATKYPRVLEAITSLANKRNILVSVYKSSGYELSDEMQHHNPHIWTVPNLRRVAFWNPNTISQLQNIVTPVVFNNVMTDFKKVNSTKLGWKLNSTPSGKWRIYPLFNQGRKIVSNCVNCSETVKFVTSLQPFMRGCIFGNALFSVLDPSSSIEPHTGPCNFRLRCHLPLMVPSGFKIQVGTETREWRTRELLVFDDSLVHNVWSEEYGAESRVVFIFDIWHPKLKPDEIDLLMHCYSDP